MAVTFHLPGPLCAFAGGRGRIVLDASPTTVREALAALEALHPGVVGRVLTEEGRVRPHVNKRLDEAVAPLPIVVVPDWLEELEAKLRSAGRS